MNRQYIIVASMAFLLLETTLIFFIDRPLSEYLRNLDNTHPDFINFFRAYTDIGKSKWWLIMSAAGAAVCALLTHSYSLPKKLRVPASFVGQKFFYFFIYVAMTGIVTDIIKPIIGRARPVLLERENIYDFHPFMFHAQWNGMPSGHATTAFTIATVLALYFPKGQVLWFFCAAAIAISRVMVNAHYPSDILAGAAIGMGTVFLLSKTINLNVIRHIQCSIFPIDKKVEAD